MEKFVDRVPRYRRLQDGFEEVEKYKCSDGKVWNTEKEALEWERILNHKKKFNELEYISVASVEDIGLNINIWYRPKNEEQLELLRTHFNMGNYKVHMIGQFVVGGWYGIEEEYDSDGDAFKWYVYNLEELRNMVDNYFGLFGERLKHD